MRQFSIPYNNDIHLLEKLVDEFPEYKQSCSEIFFASPKTILRTGRALPQDINYEEEVYDLIKTAKKHNILTNLLFNASCNGVKLNSQDAINQVIRYLYKFKEEHNIDIVTVSDYILARDIKKAIPEILLECSSIAAIEDPVHAEYWADIGTDIIVISPTFNKNIESIKRLRKQLGNVSLKLMVNQDCLPSCPMRRGHNNMQSHGDDGEMMQKLCESILDNNPWLWYSSTFIPPKYLDYYDDYVDSYKLVDRKYPTDKIIKAFGAYCGDHRYQKKADKWNQRIPEEVFQKVIHCEKYCKQCNFCFNYYQSMDNKDIYVR